MRLLLLIFSALMAQGADCPYSFVIRGGHVIDPANNRDSRMDVAIKDSKIEKVAAKIAVPEGCPAIDATGLYVTPGLIDIHAHVYTNTGLINQLAGDLSVLPDEMAPHTGVTTIVDAGTSGHENFEDFKLRIIDKSRTRVLAFLNVTSQGMSSAANEQDAALMNAEAVGKMALKHKDLIVGIKTAHYGAPDWIAIDTALAASKIAGGIPLMVDFGRANSEKRNIEDLMRDKLKPGDIYTHMYSGLRNELLPTGKLNPVLSEARKRGILFDLGHGNGSFFWPVAKQAFAEGFLPDSISTDLHKSSYMAGMKNMNNVMSKFLIHDVPLKEVIRMSTVNAAKNIRRPALGTLTEGAEADIAILKVERGNFGYLDNRLQRVKGNQRLTTELTMRAGKVIYDLNGLGSTEWKPGGVLPGTKLP